MSDNTAPRRRNDQQAIDSLLADAGMEDTSSLRTELLELRSLANTAPMPSDAVRALMVGGPAATQMMPAMAPEATQQTAPVDELAARRRKKGRAAVVGLAVAVSLAGGATAAAASEGGIPGAFEHLGAAIGSVVSQLTPGSGNAPQPHVPAGTTPAQDPSHQESQPAVVPNQPTPAPSAPLSPAGTPHADPQATPGHGQTQDPKAPRTDPGKDILPPAPSLPVTPPEIDPSKLDPTKLRPSDIPVPVLPTLPAK
ncbi:hypothetical protein [Paenarthrobacter sp. JL.01a]|uniref:hypothetical protein n=1 Tax=Paenarthrobacter sp. JL.01a TaxID=2979324 RepID=UPI0021C66EEA|nr:hypothetical protein [Paenarthrobacter sp. JL.01a]UXM91436.1 hypothetical protein N5P29_19410 [Paenarthrobacter sp. JL.01a]